MPTLDDLKTRIKETPISMILSHYMSLSSKGKLKIGLCPFHNDTSPSLQVNDSKEMFMCFACNTGGDAITFVRKFRNITYIEALEEISKILNIPFDEYNSAAQASPDLILARKIVKVAAELYRTFAANDGKNEYHKFLSNRKLSEDTAKKFFIGLSPETNIVTNYLKSIKDEKNRHNALEMAQKIFLIRKSQSGELFDTFRSRIMFPIWDQSGHVVGFGGRATKDNQTGKYINSQESFLFNKKNILYGFHLAKNSIRESKSVILVEGYMDLIALHQHGLTNSIAVMGIGLNNNNVILLKNLATNIYLGLDSDTAGENAKIRINNLFLEEGIITKNLDFSPNKDPDEFLQEKSRNEMDSLIQNSPYFIDYVIEKKLKQSPQETEEKIALLNEVFNDISPLKEDLRALERVSALALGLKLSASKEDLINSYKNFLKKEKHQKIVIHNNKLPISKNNIHNNATIVDTAKSLINLNDSNPTVSSDTLKKTTQRQYKKLSKTEKYLIKEVTLHPEIINPSKMDKIIEDVDNDQVKMYLGALKTLFLEVDRNNFPTHVKEIIESGDFSPEIQGIVGLSLSEYYYDILNDEVIKDILNDIQKRLVIEKLTERKNRLTIECKNCSDSEKENEMMAEIYKLRKELEDIKNRD